MAQQHIYDPSIGLKANLALQGIRIRRIPVGPFVGAMRVVDLAEYDAPDLPPVRGFAIEQYRYANTDEPVWCIPAWDEAATGFKDVYETRAEADAALAPYLDEEA